jgi:hypothetical protein
MVQAPELITIKARIQSAGATTAPDFQVPAGTFAAATNTVAGVYTVTLREKYPTFVGGIGSVLTAIGTPGTSTADLVVVFDAAGYDSTTGVLTFTVVGADGGTAAEDVPDNDWIYLELTFCRRSTLCPSGALPV